MTAATVSRFDLDPSLVDYQTYYTRRRRYLLDFTAILNLMVIVLMLIPSRLVVPAVPSVGRPALMIGAVVTTTWIASKLHPRLVMRGPQPMRWVACAFLMSFLLSYAAGWLRGLTGLEGRSADRSLIFIYVFLGVIVAAADGVPNRRRLNDLLRLVVWCGAGMAFIGLLQVITGIDVTQYIKIPGLQLAADLEGLAARGAGFFRVGSTATHYIEFSTVMAMILPFAIHVARFGETRLTRQFATISAFLIAAAIPMALSRTGVVALAMVMATMMLAWNWRMRFNVAVLGIGLIGALMVARPGLVGTIISLFSDLGSDPSIQGRTGDYDIVYEYIAERPWLGRGPGTFIPELYILLDNQWLGQLVSTGIIGMVALAGIHISAIALALIALRRATTEEDKHLCAVLIAIQLLAIVVAGTFDSLGFTTFATLFALFTGLTGAIWRLTHPAREVRTTAPARGR